VKASTWEQPFHKRISAARALELSVLKTTLMLQVWSQFQLQCYALLKEHN
jgi:hypothetical protein